MKSSYPWIIAGIGAGVATYFLLRQQPAPRYATGSDAVEDAAGSTATWGDKQRIAGSGTNLVGKVKEGIGRVAGDPNLADEGAADQMEGAARDAVGKVANAAAQTLHDLNI